MKYKITEKRLKELLENEAQVYLLEMLGVDNWDGFSNIVTPEDIKGDPEYYEEMVNECPDCVFDLDKTIEQELKNKVIEKLNE